jgi:ribosome-associated heat shock protein Hsp15
MIFLNMSDTVRIDKWLWAVRLYKTRTLAAESVKLGRVLLSGQPVKPSRLLKIGDVIQVQSPDLLRTIKITALADKRMGAKLVPDHLEDLTPPDDGSSADWPLPALILA